MNIVRKIQFKKSYQYNLPIFGQNMHNTCTKLHAKSHTHSLTSV